MLFKPPRLGAVGSRGMWARNSLGGGKKPSTLLWDDACGKGGEGGMSKEGGPSGDEGSRDGLAQGFRALAGSGMGELAEEPCSFCAPAASSFWTPCTLSHFDPNMSPERPTCCYLRARIPEKKSCQQKMDPMNVTSRLPN